MKHHKSGDRHVICLVIPSLQAGGMERVMSGIANFFSSKADVDLHLVLYGIDRKIFYEISENTVVHTPEFTFSNKRRLFNTIRTLLFLRKTIKEIDPETILSFGEYWNNFVLLALRGLKYPIYVSDRSQPDKSLGKFHDKLRCWLYSRAKGLIMQTEKAKEIYLRNSSHENIAVIGNPIPSFRNVDSSHKREKSVLMVGRLIRTKHQDKLIEMFAKVAPADWLLRIVGDDQQNQHHMDRLKRLARNLGIEKQVIFMGKQSQIEEIYLNSSIFAFTSSSEGFPNVIGEAMSAGLPVIAFDCMAGPSDMIEDGHNGFLIPLFDTDQFEYKLDLLIREEHLRREIGSNARESIKKFSAEMLYESFFQFILA